MGMGQQRIAEKVVHVGFLVCCCRHVKTLDLARRCTCTNKKKELHNDGGAAARCSRMAIRLLERWPPSRKHLSASEGAKWLQLSSGTERRTMQGLIRFGAKRSPYGSLWLKSTSVAMASAPAP